LRLGLWCGWRDREGSLCILSFRLASDGEGFILNLQASRITVARALFIELHAASAGWLFERAFLLRFPAVLAARRWLASVDHIVEQWTDPGLTTSQE
jgi:hypothetical protein